MNATINIVDTIGSNVNATLDNVLTFNFGLYAAIHLSNVEPSGAKICVSLVSTMLHGALSHYT